MRLAIALFVGLGLLAGPAVAGKRVDWSSYIESPAERAQSQKLSSTPAARETPKASKVSKKKAKAKRAAKKAKKGKRARR